MREGREREEENAVGSSFYYDARPFPNIKQGNFNWLGLGVSSKTLRFICPLP